MRTKILALFKSAAFSLLIVIVGGASGWFAVRMLKPTSSPGIVNGDFSSFVDRAQQPIVLFGTSTCPFCRKARDLLDGLKANYRFYEIDTSADAELLYRSIGINTVPILITRDSRIVGFSETMYRLQATQHENLRSHCDQKPGTEEGAGSATCT